MGTQSTWKKRVVLGFKIILATVLMVWVLSQAHWQDYVVAKDGTTWTWLPRVEGGKQFVAESYLSALLAGRQERRTRVFVPDEFVPVDPSAAKDDYRKRYVRRGFITSVARMNLGWFALAVVGVPLSLMAVAYRFWYLLKKQQVHIRLWESIRLTFLGQFFNMVVPGTVGGDLVKAWYVSKHTDKTAAVLVTILFDRLMGMVELMLLSAAMLGLVLLTGHARAQEIGPAILSVSVLFAVVLGLGLFLYCPPLRRLLHLQRLYSRLKIVKHAEAARRAVRIVARQPRALLWALMASFVGHIFLLGSCALLGVALSLGVEILTYFLYLPLIYIIGAIPVTPGGMGLIEKLYVEFFSGPTVSASSVIAMAMLARLLLTVWGLPGLLVAIRGAKLPPTEDMQAELEQAEQEIE